MSTVQCMRTVYAYSVYIVYSVYEYKGVHRVQYLCYGMRAIPACCDDSSTHGVFGSGGSFWTIPAACSGRFRVEHLTLAAWDERKG